MRTQKGRPERLRALWGPDGAHSRWSPRCHPDWEHEKPWPTCNAGLGSHRRGPSTGLNRSGGTYRGEKTCTSWSSRLVSSNTPVKFNQSWIHKVSSACDPSRRPTLQSQPRLGCTHGRDHSLLMQRQIFTVHQPAGSPARRSSPKVCPAAKELNHGGTVGVGTGVTRN